MKKVLFGFAVSLAIFSGVNAASAQFAAIATNADGDTAYRASLDYTDMEQARRDAVKLCQQRLGKSCDKTVAESFNHYFAGVRCNGVNYVGASKHNFDTAKDVAANKGYLDGNYDCVATALYHRGKKVWGSDGNY